MKRKVKKFIKKYKEAIDEKYNVDMDLSDYSRLPFNKVDLENAKPIVKSVKQKNAVLACCASSVLTAGIVLAIVLPLTLPNGNNSEIIFNYSDKKIIEAVFDNETASPIFNFNNSQYRFTLYTGTIDSNRNLLYVSTLGNKHDYKYYFEFNDYSSTFIETNDHFPIPEAPLKLYFKVYSDNAVFVESTITIK